MNILEVAMEQHGDLLWYVDGRDLREIVAEVEAAHGEKYPGNYWGARTGAWYNPVRMALGEIRDDPLCFYEEGDSVPAYAWLLTCECTEPTDFAVVADVEFDGDIVWWRNLRVMTAATEPPTRQLGLSFSFEVAQYRQALTSHKTPIIDPRPPIDTLAERRAQRTQNSETDE